MDNGTLGISFAPTADQAELGPRRGTLEGLPQAIKILSLHMPRILGVRAPVNSALVSPNAGAQGGVDPFLSALMQTLSRTMAPTMPPMHSAGLPGGTAGPDVTPINVPPYQPSADGVPSLPTQAPKTRTHWQDGGGMMGDGTGASYASTMMRRNMRYSGEDDMYGRPGARSPF
jgi:hypothetical protein